MTASFVAYVDESGDEGFKFLPNEQGSSRWFVLSAMVIRKENDLQVVQLARQARELLKKDAKKALHFRELRHEQRVPLARLIGDAPVRTVSVLVHKPSISKLKFGQAGSDVRVDWSVVDPQRIRAVNHDQLAGLQLADAVASGVFFSVHRNPYGEYEDRYLRLMGKTIYRNKGTVDGYGLKFWCADGAETARVLQAADALRQSG